MSYNSSTSSTVPYFETLTLAPHIGSEWDKHVRLGTAHALQLIFDIFILSNSPDSTLRSQLEKYRPDNNGNGTTEAFECFHQHELEIMKVFDRNPKESASDADRQFRSLLAGFTREAIETDFGKENAARFLRSAEEYVQDLKRYALNLGKDEEYHIDNRGNADPYITTTPVTAWAADAQQIISVLAPSKEYLVDAANQYATYVNSPFSDAINKLSGQIEHILTTTDAKSTARQAAIAILLKPARKILITHNEVNNLINAQKVLEAALRSDVTGLRLGAFFGDLAAYAARAAANASEVPNYIHFLKNSNSFFQQIAILIPLMVVGDIVFNSNDINLKTPKGVARMVGLCSYLIGLPQLTDISVKALSSQFKTIYHSLSAYYQTANRVVMSEASAVAGSELVGQVLEDTARAASSVGHTSVTASEVSTAEASIANVIAPSLHETTAVASGEARTFVGRVTSFLGKGIFSTVTMKTTFGFGDIAIGVGQVWGGIDDVQSDHKVRGGLSITAGASGIVSGVAILASVLAVGLGATVGSPILVAISGVVAVSTVLSLGFGIAAAFS